MPVTYMTPFSNKEDTVTDATLTLTTPNEIIPVGAILVISTVDTTVTGNVNDVVSITGTGNTTQDSNIHLNAASSSRASAFYEAQHWLLVTNAIAANTVLTITFGHSSARKNAVGRAYQGLTGTLERGTGNDAEGTLGETSNGTQGGSAATQTIPGSEMGSTTAAACLLVATFAMAGTGCVATAGTGWTADAQIITNIGSSDRGVFQEHRETTVAGLYDATANFSPSSAFAGSMLAFPISGGGGGGGGSTLPEVITNQVPDAYWRLGEAEGVTSAVDVMGAHTGGPIAAGVGQGRPGGISGDSNTSMAFDSPSDGIPTAGWSLSSGSYSVHALINLQSAFPTTFHETIIGFSDAGGTQRASFVARRNATGNRLAYWDNTNSWQETGQTIPANTWVMVHLVKSGTNLKIYLNKVEVGNFTITEPGDVYTNVYLGAGVTTVPVDPLKGDLDEVAVWSRAISAAEVAADFDIWTPPTTVINPTVNAGPDQIDIEPGQTVTLDASASTVGSGTFTSRLWDQTVGSPIVVINNAATAVATFEAPYTLAGVTLTFRHTAQNSVGGIDSDLVNITVLRCTERSVETDGLEHPVKLYPV